jgi:uncharacterized cupredoxin-like copper-binding protein
MRRRAGAATVLAAALIGACGGGGGGSGGDNAGGDPARPPDLTVSVKEFRFEPAELTVDAGKPSVVAVDNIGTIDHDFTVQGTGFKITVAKAHTERGTLTVSKPGTYEFYCSLPGHKSAGMHGTLTVK